MEFDLDLKGKQKLTKVTAKKYRLSSKKEKTRILDTFIDQTDYGRKYAIHILANESKVTSVGKKLKVEITHKSRKKRVYPVIYGKDVLEALEPIWRAFNLLYIWPVVKQASCLTLNRTEI